MRAEATVTLPALGPEAWMVARQLAERVCVGDGETCVHKAHLEAMDQAGPVTVTGICEAP